MRILFVSSQALFAGTRFGGAKRLYYMAKELERYAEVTVLCLDGCREIDPRSPPPPDFGRMLMLPLDPVPNFPGRAELLPGVRGVFARHRKAIESLAGTGEYDALLMAYPLALRFLDFDWPCRFRRSVFMDDDLMIEQYRKKAGAGPLAGRLAGLLRYGQFRRFYRSRLAKVHTFVGIPREEADIVGTERPGLDLQVLGYGIPLGDYPFLGDPPDRAVLGFIGNYRHPPNLDAARWLVEELFPYFAASVPGTRLILAGRHLPSDLCGRLPEGGAIEAWGEVPDLSIFFRSIGIFINPVRQGRGMRTKVVEAAAFGRPILSTSLGAEGLDLLSLGVGDGKEALLKAYRERLDPGFHSREARRNRETAEAAYSISGLGKALAHILAEEAAPGGRTG
ncbi:MAG: glycosyltransferase family 4 protein [Fibrobacterota bacterium]|nr:glycosyltransferase family 4 protein [Fibrobacterota bacterium]